MLILFGLLFFIACSYSTYSQEMPENGLNMGLLEGYEFVLPASEAKVDLNKIDQNTLLSFYFLSPMQVEQLLRHRQRFGEWKCVEELQSCDFLRGTQIDSLRSLVEVPMSYFPTTKPNAKFQAYWMCRYLQQDSMDIRNFSAKLGLRTHYRWQLNDLSAFHLTAERDAGEKWLYKKSYHPFDYCTMSLNCQSKSSRLHYILGDYEVLFGYGLGLYQGYLLASRTAWSGIQASTTLFKSHTGMRENGFCEGAALEWNLKRLALGVFVSYRRLDNNSQKSQISLSQAFQSSGLHLSSAGQEARQSVPFYQAGAELKYSMKQGLVAGYLLSDVMPLHQLILAEHVFDFSWKSPFMQAGVCGHYTFRNTYVQAECVIDNYQNFKYQIRLIRPFYGGDLYVGFDDCSRQVFNFISLPTALNASARYWNMNWQSPFFLKSSKVNIGCSYQQNDRLLKDEPFAQGIVYFRCERALTKKQTMVFTCQERWDMGVWGIETAHFPNRSDNHRRVVAIGAKSEELGLGTFSWLVEMSLGKAQAINGVLSSCKQKFRLRHIPGTWNIECQFYQIKDYQNRMYLLHEDWPGTMIQTAFSGDGIRGQISWKFPFSKSMDFSCYLGKKWQFSPMARQSLYGLLSIQLRV